MMYFIPKMLELGFKCIGIRIRFEIVVCFAVSSVKQQEGMEAKGQVLSLNVCVCEKGKVPRD